MLLASHLLHRTWKRINEMTSVLPQYAGVMFVSGKWFSFQSVHGPILPSANPLRRPPQHRIMSPHVIPLKMATVISLTAVAKTLCNAPNDRFN